MMKKRGLALLLVLILTMTSSLVFAQTDNTIVRIDSTNVEFDDEEFGKPFIDENDRTLVPFRAALEAFGAEVDWDQATRTAKAVKGDITVEVPIGEAYIVKNGEEIENDTIAVIKDDRTYLPIRAIMEAFGADVQWDRNLRTVVITSEPIDAKANVLAANEKTYEWENYDMKILMNMSIVVPEEGSADIQMVMNATVFNSPIMKLGTDALMIMEVEGMQIPIPMMEMYMVAEDNKMISYTGNLDPSTGELIWIVQEIEDDSLAELLDPNNEEIKELNKQSIKDVKYLGNYSIEGKDLEKYEVTISFEGFDAIFKQSMAMVSGILTDEDIQMSLDLLANLDDITYIMYVDQASGEFAKMEMDLTSLMNSIFEQIPSMMGIGTELPEGLTEEDLVEQLKAMKIEVDMVAEYLNINSAEDFEIPEEALNGMSMEEYELYIEELLKPLKEEATE